MAHPNFRFELASFPGEEHPCETLGCKNRTHVKWQGRWTCYKCYSPAVRKAVLEGEKR